MVWAGAARRHEGDGARAHHRAAGSGARRGTGVRTEAPDDEQEVLAVVQRLFDAMRTKDTAAMRQVFDSQAVLVGMRPGKDGAPPHVQRITCGGIRGVHRARPATAVDRAGVEPAGAGKRHAGDSLGGV